MDRLRTQLLKPDDAGLVMLKREPSLEARIRQGSVSRLRGTAGRGDDPGCKEVEEGMLGKGENDGGTSDFEYQSSSAPPQLPVLLSPLGAMRGDRSKE
jgi:hypothetical protein